MEINYLFPFKENIMTKHAPTTESEKAYIFWLKRENAELERGRTKFFEKENYNFSISFSLSPVISIIKSNVRPLAFILRAVSSCLW